MPDAAPRWSAGTAFMTRRVFGAANRPEPMPLSDEQRGERRVGEVGREQHQADEADAP